MNSPVSPAQAASELLRRREARRSLIGFTQYTKPDYQSARHHKIISEHLEAVERGEIKRLIIEAPPRHGKSELASRRFPSWYLGRNAGKQVICATYNADFAADIGREVRNVVGSPEYGRLFDCRLRADSTAANRWHTDQGGVYVAAGVGTALTGRGGDLGLIDDPFKDRKEADSENRRKDVWDWYRAVFYTRLMPNAGVVLMNTRWHELDLTGRILEQADESGEDWVRLSLPAITEGKALWPEWYDIDTLERIRKTLGPRDWLSLYQQTPTAEDGTYFLRDWVRHYHQAPDHMTVYMTGDFAVTEGGGDYTELAVWGVDTLDNIYVLDWWSGQASADRWGEEWMRLIKRWEPTAFVAESGPIRRALEPSLTKLMHDRRCYTVLQWQPTSADKPSSARPFQALMANGRVFWPATEWAERVVDQLLRFPDGRNDDAVDACARFGQHIHKTWAAVAPPPPKTELAEAFQAPLKIADVMRPSKPPSW